MAKKMGKKKIEAGRALDCVFGTEIELVRSKEEQMISMLTLVRAYRILDILDRETCHNLTEMLITVGAETPSLNRGVN